MDNIEINPPRNSQFVNYISSILQDIKLILTTLNDAMDILLYPPLAGNENDNFGLIENHIDELPIIAEILQDFNTFGL